MSPVPPLATGRLPVTAVVRGSPVALVSTSAEGVPSAGVTSVGEVDSTLLPEPVEVVTPVPPLSTGSVPVTPVLSGSPVALVSTPEAGVPSAGLVNVGEVSVTPAKVATVPPSETEVDPIVTAELVSCALLTVPVRLEVGNPVALVKTNAVGVPRLGVTRVGEVCSTAEPEPVAVVEPVPPAVTGSVPVASADVEVA